MTNSRANEVLPLKQTYTFLLFFQKFIRQGIQINLFTMKTLISNKMINFKVI